MRLYRNFPALRIGRGPARRVATIGAFDGLHAGHGEILARTTAAAAARDCPSVVCSFEPMPTEFFAPSNPPARLTCFRERFDLLAAAAIDEFFCPHFGMIRNLTPDEFIKALLVDGLNVAHVVVGHDFRFGLGRTGKHEDLHRAGRKFGFGVTTVEPVSWRDQRISSTAIRDALMRGDLGTAKSMLGRDYSMSGRVVPGIGLGRKLGFPTANVNLKRRLAPVDGIFAVRVEGIADEPLDGVASVGNRPMVGGGKTLLEVFIFDFDCEIYGRYITVNFVMRLREERTFEDLDAMTRQMRLDVRDARAALAS